MTLFFLQTGAPVEGMVFESPWGHKRVIALMTRFSSNRRPHGGDGIRVPLGALYRIYPEPHQLGVEQFLELLRFEQRSKLEELPVTFR